MSRTVLNLWRMYVLEFQKVGWDIIGTTYCAVFLILFDANIEWAVQVATFFSTWIAVRLYFPVRARRRAEYEACLPVSWVCVTSARFCVLMTAWALLLALPAFLVEDMRGYRMVGWLAMRLPEGNAIENLWRQFSRGAREGDPWMWLCMHWFTVPLVSGLIAAVLHVPRWWKVVVLVPWIATMYAFAWPLYLLHRSQCYSCDHGLFSFLGRHEWRVILDNAHQTRYWLLIIACAAVLLLVKTTSFSKRGGGR